LKILLEIIDEIFKENLTKLFFENLLRFKLVFLLILK
jgi:hypothetical protein